MSRKPWDRKAEDAIPYEGIRPEEYNEIGRFDSETQTKIGTILEAMENTRAVIFEYTDRSRIVAPFVFGVSSGGNPLLRGYLLEGASLSPKGSGWRVFQIKKMDRLELHWEYFNPDEFDFVRDYPWIFSVIKML